MAPHRRDRERRHPGSDRPNDNRNPDSRAGRAGRDFRDKRPGQDQHDGQPENERRTRTKKVKPKGGPLGPVPSEIDELPPLLAQEGENRPPVRPVKVREVENRPVRREQDDRGKRENKKKRGPDEPHEHGRTTDSDSRPVDNGRRARHDFGKARDRSKAWDYEQPPDTKASGAKVGRPPKETKHSDSGEPMEDPYVPRRHEKESGKADDLSKERLKEKFQGLVQKSVGQTKEGKPGHDPEKTTEDKRESERIQNERASDAIKKVIEHGESRLGGVRGAYERSQLRTHDMLVSLAEVASAVDTTRGLERRCHTQDLVRDLKEGEDPVQAFREFQMRRIAEGQRWLYDVGRLPAQALHSLTDTSFNHQDDRTSAASAIMEAYRKTGENIVASSPLKQENPGSKDFSEIPNPSTFRLKMMESYALSDGAAELSKKSEEGSLKRMGVLTSLGLGCAFIEEQESGGSSVVNESWKKTFVMSNSNPAAIHANEFSRPALVSYERRQVQGESRMCLSSVSVLGDKPWEDLRTGKTYEDLYAEMKESKPTEIAERLLPFAQDADNHSFAVHGLSGPLRLNPNALWAIANSNGQIQVKDLNGLELESKELRNGLCLTRYEARDLGMEGRYLEPRTPATGNPLTDITTGSWMLASILGQHPQLTAERRLTKLVDKNGVVQDIDAVGRELDQLRSNPKELKQRLAELFRSAQRVEFGTVRPIDTKDPLAGLLLDKATESVAGPITRVYGDAARVANELAKGDTSELEHSASESLLCLGGSGRGEGVSKAEMSISHASLTLGDEQYSAELREHINHKKLGRHGGNDIGVHGWATIERQGQVQAAGIEAERVFDGFLAAKRGSGNPELFIHLPAAYHRGRGESGELYDCLEHIRRAPRGEVRELQIAGSTVRVRGGSRVDYHAVFTKLMLAEMREDGATTQEQRTKWIQNHMDPIRTIGIVGSLSAASKIATITKRGEEAFTEFGGSINVSSAIIGGSPENISGKLHSSGAMAGEARHAAERIPPTSEEAHLDTLKERPGVTFEVIEAKKQSALRTDGMTGQDGQFRLKFTNTDGTEQQMDVEIWTRSIGTKKGRFLSQDTDLPGDDGHTVRISIGHALPHLGPRSLVIGRGRPLEEVFDGINGIAVRMVSAPSEPGPSTGPSGKEEDKT